MKVLAVPLVWPRLIGVATTAPVLKSQYLIWAPVGLRTVARLVAAALVLVPHT